MIPLMLLACAEAEPEAPTLSFLAPSEGEGLPLGDNTASLLVENFELQSPAKHNEGLPLGYVELRLDGDLVAAWGSTQVPFTLSTAGEHTLDAELLYADGDPLDPPVSASVGVVGQEDG